MEENRCPKCNALLIYDNNKYICEYCKSEFTEGSFNSTINIENIIPFNIDKEKAIDIYKSNIKPKILVPSIFKSKKTINKIEGVYVPCYIYNLNSTGVVEFETDKTSNWKSRGIKYQKTDGYKVTRGANINLKNITVPTNKNVDSDTFKMIEPYNYESIISFEDNYLKGYKLCKPNKTKESLKNDIETKCKDIFVKVVSDNVKEYDNLKKLDNSINLYNPSRKYVLLPLYLLNVNYKNKTYKTMINGQTGKLYGDYYINKKRLIYIWIIIFVIVLISMIFIEVIL